MNGSIWGFAGRGGVALLWVGLCVLPALGDTIRVPADQPSLRAAIAVAQPGDTVLVADGTYRGPDNRDLDYGGKAITLRSENGPENCIIDCESAGGAFIFQSGETTAAVLDGFKIINGNPTTRSNGGAIDCTLESGPTIMNCVFENNRAQSLGGAIACRGLSLAVIKRCTFINNVSRGHPEGSQGGAVSCFVLSDATITDCVFIGNDSRYGGAISCSISFPTITNCLFVDNRADIGGGAVYCGASDPLITNCTFTENSALLGGGVGLFGVYLPSYPVLTNCILWNDSPNEIEVRIGEPIVTYSTIQGGWDGPGNLDADPIFVGETLVGSIDGFRLHRTSPCIDAANNHALPDGIDTDLSGNPRRVDDPATEDTGLGDPPLVDMGAFEFRSCTADIDRDGDVDLADLSTLLAAYGTGTGDPGYDPAADLDFDDDVDLGDLAILLPAYGVGCP
jgi:predicted outer membrane repeat protein